MFKLTSVLHERCGRYLDQEIDYHNTQKIPYIVFYPVVFKLGYFDSDLNFVTKTATYETDVEPNTTLFLKEQKPLYELYKFNQEILCM